MTNVLQKPFTRFWANNPPEYNRNWNDPFAGGNIYDINFGNTTRTGYYAVKFRGGSRFAVRSGLAGYPPGGSPVDTC